MNRQLLPGTIYMHGKLINRSRKTGSVLLRKSDHSCSFRFDRSWSIVCCQASHPDMSSLSCAVRTAKQNRALPIRSNALCVTRSLICSLVLVPTLFPPRFPRMGVAWETRKGAAGQEPNCAFSMCLLRGVSSQSPYAGDLNLISTKIVRAGLSCCRHHSLFTCLYAVCSQSAVSL